MMWKNTIDLFHHELIEFKRLYLGHEITLQTKKVLNQMSIR